MKFVFILSLVHFISPYEWDGKSKCPRSCNCLESFVDCSDKDLKRVPSDLPPWTNVLDLTNNSLQESGVLDVLKNYPNLKELKFDWNQFTNIPITSRLQNLSVLSVSYNKITSWDPHIWTLLPNLKFLDVSYNEVENLIPEMFPKSCVLLSLNLNNNKISYIKKDSFDGFRKLRDLKLSRNHLAHLGKDVFRQLSNLRSLDLNRNRFTRIEGLTFKGLENLTVLKIRQNFVSSLEDGSFWGLQNLHILKLDHNKIRNVSKGWTYGLTSLRELFLGMNRIHFIETDAWEACKYLKSLDLSNNDLTEIHFSTFEHLTELIELKLNNNGINSIQEGSFNSTPELKVLDLGQNKISWLIEDTSGVFIGLRKLQKLSLASNEITSINQKAFYGLTSLSELDLTANHIKTIQENAFINLPLHILLMNTSSLICDCSLAWFQVWLVNNRILLPESYCTYPELLKGKNFTSIPVQGFLCSKNESLKPIITQGPESKTTVLGSKVNISCTAWSSSNSTLNFKWKQNNDDVDSRLTETFNNTAVLYFNHILPGHAGKYQCIVFNDFGTVYSKKATLKVLVLPVMVKKPGNLTVKAGSTAKLECSAIGEPTPQVAWQKDGGIEFPAAQERRMHVMPSDDVFFIVNAKPIDSGLYSCIAENSAGTVTANATLTVQEAPTFTKKMEDKEVRIGMSTVFECMGSGWPKPKIRWWKDGVLLSSSYRHFMTASDQLLIITDVKDIDAGMYQCEMSNLLGNEKTTAYLSIKSGYSTSCDNITGVMIISIVCCAVGTSAVWVIIIYQTRRHLSNNHLSSKDLIHQRTTLDNKSDNSSTSKDSGTGNSTKRSTEDFRLEVLITQESPIESSEIQETSAQVNSPLLQCSCYCSDPNARCSCSPLQREQTRSNHERCKSDRPFSTPINKSEMPLVRIHTNNSYSCLYKGNKPTEV